LHFSRYFRHIVLLLSFFIVLLISSGFYQAWISHLMGDTLDGEGDAIPTNVYVSGFYPGFPI